MGFSELKGMLDEHEKTAGAGSFVGDMAQKFNPFRMARSSAGEFAGAVRRTAEVNKDLTGIRKVINTVGQSGIEGAGLVAKGSTYPFRAVGGSAVKRTASNAANVARRGVAAAPLTAAATIGMAPLMLPDIRGATAGHRQEMAQLMAQRQMGPQKIGLASSLISEDDKRAASSIRRQLEKRAAKQNPLAIAATLAAVSTALGVGSTLGGHVMGKAYEGIRAGDRPQRFRAMLKAEPSLKKERYARTYFNVLDRASPYIAGEPFIAAATVRSMIETPSLIDGGVPSVGPKMMKEIMDAEESRQKSRFHPFKTVKPFKASLPSGFGEAGE